MSFAPTAPPSTPVLNRLGRAMVGRARMEKRLPTDDPNDRALEAIPVAEAEIFRRFCRGETKRDIAAREGYPITLVHSAISVARRAIRDRLAEAATPVLDRDKLIPIAGATKAILSHTEIGIIAAANAADARRVARVDLVALRRACGDRSDPASVAQVQLALHTLQQRRVIVYAFAREHGSPVVLIAPWANSADLFRTLSELTCGRVRATHSTAARNAGAEIDVDELLGGLDRDLPDDMDAIPD